MDLPELDDLRFFTGIAAAGTLTEAARVWGVSVSAVSKRLARLERRLGARLVNRSTRRLTLTDEGRRYAEGAVDVLGRIDDLEDDIGRRSARLHGRIAIHATMGFGRSHLAPLLGSFGAAHPDLRIDLELSHLPVHVGGTGYDFAVRAGPLPDSRMHARPLLRNRRVVCAAPSYVARRGEPRTLGELAEHDCIVIRENDTAYAHWRFGTGADVAGVRVTGSTTCNDGEVATAWCLAGRGLVMRSLWQVAPLLEAGELVQVLPGIPTPPADLVAVHDASPPRRVVAALDHLVAGLAERLPAAGSPLL
ncbi:Transcriptional regulator, LysR family [Pseudonocardia sp. Ae168_Ps1]|uniref:LysR family transcriptional regulator n=1 Tax=unclassified Pseudonocardia TaxID=2619320 RepID=UPI00094B3DE7|nr:MULTISPECIES: LysR family transcriptional regulator [unclassified Pseudonocardia]OLL75540.1 Transcriptional regulator, LysR family [Pseudonocardia sp. Ae150A_Ps1]OLL81535.1 Transcriptional regulator, LysR family [Pseudonocardia sp. Ae168_Ps1]OLL84352.1 Transcriptional regulator, LysR family [Pseudonocardia sp. Ae263_Ps1]OLL95630.1 Transcriptional regulator, LysR family [Pseudonocardia sp. Ae356_Ps1]